QAEIDRITSGSRDPDLLRELLAALGNDPALIAETLARQALADRLTRRWYATDSRFHADLRRRAERALASCDEPSCMKSMGGRYVETTWQLRSTETGRGVREGVRDGGVYLDASAWRDHLARWASKVGGSPDAITKMRLSPLQEDADLFSVGAVV